MDFRSAIVYFELVCEDYNIEEDANNGDPAAQNLLNNDRALLNQENLAVNSLKKLFKKNISNEGHGSGGQLVCKFGVNSVKELIDADRVLSRNHTGGDDEIDTGVAYFSARGFRFYPDGVNNGFYGEDSGALGTWEEWIESQKGSRLAAVKRNAAMTPAHRFAAAYINAICDRANIRLSVKGAWREISFKNVPNEFFCGIPSELGGQRDNVYFKLEGNNIVMEQIASDGMDFALQPETVLTLNPDKDFKFINAVRRNYIDPREILEYDSPNELTSRDVVDTAFYPSRRG